MSSDKDGLVEIGTLDDDEPRRDVSADKSGVTIRDARLIARNIPILELEFEGITEVLVVELVIELVVEIVELEESVRSTYSPEEERTIEYPSRLGLKS